MSIVYIGVDTSVRSLSPQALRSGRTCSSFSETKLLNLNVLVEKLNPLHLYTKFRPDITKSCPVYDSSKLIRCFELYFMDALLYI